MAIESPNTFVAGMQAVGIDGALNILGSRGLQVDTFTRTGAGRYTILLTEAVFPSSLVCLANALTQGNQPLVVHASANFIVDDTVINLFMNDDAGAPTDGANIMLGVFRSQTDF